MHKKSVKKQKISDLAPQGRQGEPAVHQKAAKGSPKRRKRAPKAPQKEPKTTKKIAKGAHSHQKEYHGEPTNRRQREGRERRGEERAKRERERKTKRERGARRERIEREARVSELFPRTRARAPQGEHLLQRG